VDYLPRITGILLTIYNTAAVVQPLMLCCHHSYTRTLQNSSKTTFISAILRCLTCLQLRNFALWPFNIQGLCRSPSLTTNFSNFPDAWLPDSLSKALGSREWRRTQARIRARKGTFVMTLDHHISVLERHLPHWQASSSIRVCLHPPIWSMLERNLIQFRNYQNPSIRQLASYHW
jgi:hypothetical protein